MKRGDKGKTTLTAATITKGIPVDLLVMPCPFCGSTGVVKPSKRSDSFVVVCSAQAECPVQPVADGTSENDAINRWNRREGDGEWNNVLKLSAEIRKITGDLKKLTLASGETIVKESFFTNNIGVCIKLPAKLKGTKISYYITEA